MNKEYSWETSAIDAHEVPRLVPLSADSSDLLFRVKYADISALSLGDPSLLRPQLSDRLAESSAALPEAKKEVALVLGANGFVGAHLVAELTRRPGTTRVYAGVRPSETETSQERFFKTVHEFGIDDIDTSKIVFTAAVPTKSRFGLPEEEFLELRRTVDMVFNSASSTDYSSSYLQMRDDWFLSLLQVLQFSLEDRRKHVTYMGSIGSLVYTSPEDFRRPDSWWYSGYCQMKWINSRVLRWLAEDGLASVTLVEAPYILGASDKGLDPGLHYSFWRILEVARNLGYFWEGEGPSYTPVDTLSDILATNATAADPLSRMIPSHPEKYSNELFAEMLNVELVPWTKFVDIITSLTSSKKVAAFLSSDIGDLIRRGNAPALLPDGYDTSWWDHRKIFDLYFSKIEFRGEPANPPRTHVGVS